MPAEKDRLSAVALAIAHPTRRALLRACSHGERRVRDLARRCPDLTLAGVSKHLQVLEDARLVVKRREGRDVYCRADLRPLGLLERFTTRYTRFWNEGLDALERQIERRRRPAKRGRR